MIWLTQRSQSMRHIVLARRRVGQGGKAPVACLYGEQEKYTMEMDEMR